MNYERLVTKNPCWNFPLITLVKKYFPWTTHFHSSMEPAAVFVQKLWVCVRTTIYFNIQLSVAYFWAWQMIKENSLNVKCFAWVLLQNL